MSAAEFYKLPAEVREKVMAEACRVHGVADFFDLDPEVRHRIYDAAS